MDSMAQQRYVFQRTVESNLTNSFLELLRSNAHLQLLKFFETCLHGR